MLIVSYTIQIEALDVASVGGNSSNSQFVSIDSNGLLVLWITTASATASSFAVTSTPEEDYGANPWAAVRLTKLKVIDLQQKGSLSQPSRLPGDAICMATLPNDSSIILTSYSRGRVRKIARLGVPVTPSYLSRPVCAVSIDDDRGTSVEAGVYFSPVTCISANALSHQKQLVLIGRRDGTVDLFASDLGTASLTWDLSAFQKRQKKAKSKSNLNCLK